MSSNSSLAFGSYDWICSEAALVVCPLLGNTGFGIEPTCYARNVELGNTLIFQPAASFLHICSLVMVLIMVLHVRSKYTAVGRTEIATFFYLYAGEEFFAIFLDSGIIPSSSPVYAWFAAIHLGLICATFWCLLLNGFVGFQFAEDGTPLSVWSFRISSFVVWLVTAFLAIATFKSVGSFSPASPTALWIVEFIFCGACAAIYTVLQFILVIRTLDDRWPIGDLLFGLFFFAAGLVIQFGFSVTICDAISHYIDGLFFNSLCCLLAVMMVYKYWDSITKEDLEFSVGSKQAVWEVKDMGYGESEGLNDFGSRYGQSYPPVKSASGYGY